ncbi:MAG TPA: glycosyltransferase, partial [Bacteroidetes bacterium]|nr:glycosyltransferase [Bacteroidota bacterium]HEX03798.1 glycosyltransferase [Bacteroidota bacterium]
DIYHYHDPELHPYMDILMRMGKKVVFDMHENYAGSMRNRLSGWKRDILPDAYASFERYMLNRLDGVVFVSQSQAEMFDGQVNRQCLIRNIIDISRLEGWTPGPRQEPPVIISAGGSLSHERHCDKLLQALPMIHEVFPDVRVRFMGKYAHGYETKLPKMAADLGVADSVDVDGWVSWRESFDELAKASIGTVFYENNENNQIGLPNRVFSYMFAGLPLLMSDYTELRRIAEETGAAEVIDTEDPRNIAQAAIELLSDNERRETLGRRGREAVFNQYNYEQALDSLEEMYEAIVLG